MSHAYIGTSGWNYRAWRHKFYPSDLAARQWLPYYAGRFDSVEINYTFYRLPTEESCETWRKQTPEHFRFAVKASRYITHIRRLRDVSEPWKTFVDRVGILGEKLGPILLQFPSSFTATSLNLKLVDEFLALARKTNPRQRLAFEFRDRSCYDRPMCAILRNCDAALVVSHSTRYPGAHVDITASFEYFRFHGPREMCASSYSDTDLAAWADRMKTRLLSNMDVYGYFNNDIGAYAPSNALTLRRQLATSPEISV